MCTQLCQKEENSSALTLFCLTTKLIHPITWIFIANSLIIKWVIQKEQFRHFTSKHVCFCRSSVPRWWRRIPEVEGTCREERRWGGGWCALTNVPPVLKSVGDRFWHSKGYRIKRSYLKWGWMEVFIGKYLEGVRFITQCGILGLGYVTVCRLYSIDGQDVTVVCPHRIKVVEMWRDLGGRFEFVSIVYKNKCVMECYGILESVTIRIPEKGEYLRRSKKKSRHVHR